MTKVIFDAHYHFWQNCCPCVFSVNHNVAINLHRMPHSCDLTSFLVSPLGADRLLRPSGEARRRWFSKNCSVSNLYPPKIISYENYNPLCNNNFKNVLLRSWPGFKINPFFSQSFLAHSFYKLWALVMGRPGYIMADKGLGTNHNVNYRSHFFPWFLHPVHDLKLFTTSTCSKICHFDLLSSQAATNASLGRWLLITWFLGSIIHFGWNLLPDYRNVSTPTPTLALRTTSEELFFFPTIERKQGLVSLLRLWPPSRFVQGKNSLPKAELV